MIYSNGQDHSENDKNKNNDDNQEGTIPSKEVIKKGDSELATDDKGRDKFSPGEADDYNPDEFATD